MIGALSLVLILSTGIYYVMGGDPGDLNASGSYEKTIGTLNLSSKDNASTLTDTISGTEITVDGNLVKNVGGFVGGMIGYLIVTGFCGVLIRSLVKIGSSFSKFTKSSADAIFSFAESAVKTAQIIPVGGAALSLGGLQQAKNNMLRDAGGYFDKKLGDQEQGILSNFYESKFGKSYEKFTGQSYEQVKAKDITQTEGAGLFTSLSKANNMEMIGQRLKQFADARLTTGGNISLQSKNFMEQANRLLTDNKEFREGLIKFTGAKLEKDAKPVFNTEGENKKLLQGLIYMLNNGYSNTVNASTLQKSVYDQIGSTDITKDTPLLGSKPATQ